MPPSGLENLHKLEVLSLYGNEISTLENLDHLGGLHVLRVGRNNISDKKNVI